MYRRMGLGIDRGSHEIGVVTVVLAGDAGQAAGMGDVKKAFVAARRGMEYQQESGLREINKILNEIGAAQAREDAVSWAGIATGYANAMHHFDLMSRKELKDVVGVIGQAGEKAAGRIEESRRPFWYRVMKKGDQ